MCKLDESETLYITTPYEKNHCWTTQKPCFVSGMRGADWSGGSSLHGHIRFWSQKKKTTQAVLYTVSPCLSAPNESLSILRHKAHVPFTPLWGMHGYEGMSPLFCHTHGCFTVSECVTRIVIIQMQGGDEKTCLLMVWKMTCVLRFRLVYCVVCGRPGHHCPYLSC